MSDPYLWLKWLHVVSATVLFGTGLGTALHMWLAHLRRDPRAIAVVARNVVLVDWLFTATSGVVQPLSGFGLVSSGRLAMLFESVAGGQLSALCGRRDVLDSGRPAANAGSRYCRCCGRRRNAATAGIRPLHARLVLARLAGLREPARRLRVDGDAAEPMVMAASRASSASARARRRSSRRSRGRPCGRASPPRRTSPTAGTGRYLESARPS